MNLLVSWMSGTAWGSKNHEVFVRKAQQGLNFLSKKSFQFRIKNKAHHCIQNTKSNSFARPTISILKSSFLVPFRRKKTHQMKKKKRRKMIIDGKSLPIWHFNDPESESLAMYFGSCRHISRARWFHSSWCSRRCLFLGIVPPPQ